MKHRRSSDAHFIVLMSQAKNHSSRFVCGPGFSDHFHKALNIRVEGYSTADILIHFH
jgi:hypothetical protein